MDIKKIPKPEDDSIKLKPLHPLLMKYFTATLFVAPTGVGKTNLIINLLDRPRFYKGKFDKVVLFSNTYYTDNIWRSCKTINEADVHLNYNDSELQKYVDEQDELKQRGEPQNMLIIFDDIIQQINKDTSLVNSLIMRSRHYYITIWITTQKFSRVSTTIRNNCSYYIIFRITNKKEHKFIVDEIAGDEIEFERMWNYAIGDKNYNFLVVSVKDKPSRMYRRQFLSYINTAV
jgi:hypothetical protein